MIGMVILLNRTREFYRYQRRRMIKKKRSTYGIWLNVDFWHAGFFSKNKYHCPERCRQIKTTPKAITYSYGDRKHNWRAQDARRIDSMNAQLDEMNLNTHIN